MILVHVHVRSLRRMRRRVVCRALAWVVVASRTRGRAGAQKRRMAGVGKMTVQIARQAASRPQPARRRTSRARRSVAGCAGCAAGCERCGGGGDICGSHFGAMRCDGCDGCDAMRRGATARRSDHAGSQANKQTNAGRRQKNRGRTKKHVLFEANLVGNLRELSLFLGLEPGVGVGGRRHGDDVVQMTWYWQVGRSYSKLLLKKMSSFFFFLFCGRISVWGGRETRRMRCRITRCFFLFR